MFARVLTAEQFELDPEVARATPRLLEVLASLRGFRRMYLMQQEEGKVGVAFSLWDSEQAIHEGGRALAEQLGPPLVPVDSERVYGVFERVENDTAPGEGWIARIVSYEGLTPEQMIAFRRAASRLSAAVQSAVSEPYSEYWMHDPPRGGVMIVRIGPDLDAIRSADQAVLASRAHPDEDPALFVSPDRMELHRLGPVAVSAASITT